MANREKKVIAGRTPNNESLETPVPEKQAEATAKPAVKKTITRRIRRRDPKKVIKKTFKGKLKAKAKINPKLGKTILAKGKVKKALIKNGVAKKRVIRRKPAQTKQSEEENDDKPPVLEPIYPPDDDGADKKRKKVAPKKDPNFCSITAAIESNIKKHCIRRRAKPKLKPAIKKLLSSTESILESIEGVVRDCASVEEVIEDVVNDCCSVEEVIEGEVVEQNKKKVSAKKLPKMELIKKEGIENALGKLGPSASNVIDMLDLNVREIKSKTVETRRHSIEKFPITNQDVKIQDSSIFNQLPRSISPKNKKPVNKARQSLDSRRLSPYTTRSDSPARILRNGKQRKLKHMNLLDGLDCDFKRRKRLCSDYSGSEISMSKLSGYESDSSFSDLASLAENSDVSSKELALKKELLETLENNPPDSIDIDSIPEKFAATIKRSLSLESGKSKTFDTNSNLCSETKEEETTEQSSTEALLPSSEVPLLPSTAVAVLPSSMVPLLPSSAVALLPSNTVALLPCNTVALLPSSAESNNEAKLSCSTEPSLSFDESNKTILLDIMKQTFNEVIDPEDVEKRTTRSSVKKDPVEPNMSTAQFYGNNTECDKEEEMQAIKEEEKFAEPPEFNGALDEPPPEEDSQTDKENIDDNKNAVVGPEAEIAETPEDLAVKTEILQALGLQTLQAAEEAKLRKLVPKTESYTGTLKTVIKLNRHEKKKGRNSLKMTLQKKGKSGQGKEDDFVGVEEDEYKIMKEGNSTWKSHHGNQSSDTAGALRKSHYSNRSNMDGSSEHTSDGDTNANEEGTGKVLVIPEKASSFSIHPGRLCKDECSHCLGKFGLFDTPCHIAQMKSVDRQNKILSTEKNLTQDSCLCDACYRYVDRKSNTPSYTSNKSLKRSSLVAPGPRQNHCHVLGCGRISSNILKRKWLIKMRKSVCQVLNIDLDNPGLHSIPICEDHYASLEHLMVCAMCKRRLARNHVHYLGQESNDLNAALNEMGIPVKLNDRPVVCKLCRYFATLVLKNPEDRKESSADFFKEYRKRLLHFHDIEVMDESQAEEPIPAPGKDKADKEQVKKRKKLSKTQNNLEPPVLEPQVDIGDTDEPKSRVPSTDSREESPSDYMIDYNNLIPNVAIECSNNDIEITRREIGKKSSVSIKRVTKLDSIKEAVDKSRKLKTKSDIAVQRLGSNPSISVRQLFPGEEDLPLSGNIEFHNVKERTPEGWEKCISTIQFDPEVKMLWSELQKPYGNQSSFLRHLILLEKYYRNGDLILSSSASNHSVNYTESVQNRLRAYDNIPSHVGSIQPLTMIPFNSKPNKSVSGSGIITSTKETAPPVPVPVAIPIPIQDPPKSIVTVSTAPSQTTSSTTTATTTLTTKILPVTISQVSHSSFLVPNPAALIPATVTTIPAAPPPPPPQPAAVRPKLPPGLISLHPGTKLPITPLVKVPQSQKIKFPITKNWRPNLIPIDPANKPEKKPGLVQVISGGKPYHISLEDYKKMCAIKRTFDLRQKRLQEQQKNSILKNIPSRKGLVISKAPAKTDSNSDQEAENNSLEKLEANLNDRSLIMPKIPKSLTVIPQTVTKKTSRPASPSLLITPRNKPAGKS